jgi:hypothetical protein
VKLEHVSKLKLRMLTGLKEVRHCRFLDMIDNIAIIWLLTASSRGLEADSLSASVLTN